MESAYSWMSQAWEKEGRREERLLWILLFQRLCLHFSPLPPHFDKNSRNTEKQSVYQAWLQTGDTGALRHAWQEASYSGLFREEMGPDTPHPSGHKVQVLVCHARPSFPAIFLTLGDIHMRRITPVHYPCSRNPGILKNTKQVQSYRQYWGENSSYAYDV